MAANVDVDELTRRLYSTAPEDFVRERGEGVRQLKDAGDTETAASFAKLAKPSVSAWGVNLLVAQRADVIDEVVDRGDTLRAAHSGGADAKQIRAAQQARQTAIRQATDSVVELTGRQLSEAHRDEIAATLEAASFDPAAAAEVRAGRLVRPLEAPTGFAPLGGLTVITGGRAGTRRAIGGQHPAQAAADEAADDEARLARASMLRAEADAALDDAESAADVAAEVRDRLAALDDERERVGAELQRVDQEISETRRQLREAERAAAGAARKATRAAARAERAEA
jgi:predicted  nucleic acid-binding Zn-ribbon protein